MHFSFPLPTVIHLSSKAGTSKTAIQINSSSLQSHKQKERQYSTHLHSINNSDSTVTITAQEQHLVCGHDHTIGSSDRYIHM